MIERPETDEMETGVGPVVECWYATAYAMPTRLVIEKSGIDFAFSRRLKTTVRYEDLFETEQEAINAARKGRTESIERLQCEIDRLDKRTAEIELTAQ